MRPPRDAAANADPTIFHESEKRIAAKRHKRRKRPSQEIVLSEQA
jgi:hypothetical protein